MKQTVLQKKQPVHTPGVTPPTQTSPARPALPAFLPCILILLLLFSVQPLAAQQDKDSDLVEYVEVTNVELIVRAMKDGQPVGGLKEKDFMLLENQIQLPITSFTEVRQKIGHKTVEEKQVTGAPIAVAAPPRKPRMFLLYFWITSRDVQYGDALDYFFDNVYIEGDQVLMVLKEKIFPIHNSSEIADARKKLAERIRREPLGFQAEYREVMRDAGRIMSRYLGASDDSGSEQARVEMRFHLDNLWTSFKYKYLLSDTKMLMALSKKLKTINMEKWGMVFYQRHAFPQFDPVFLDPRLKAMNNPSEELRMMTLLQKFKTETKLPNKSYAFLKRIKHAFVNGDTTFHVLWLSHDDRLKLTSGNSAFKMEDVFSGWLETFSGISKVTGGSVMRADRLKETIRKVVEVEDIYYRLTYAPRMKGKARRKIDVRLDRDDIKLNHVKRIELLNYSPPIATE